MYGLRQRPGTQLMQSVQASGGGAQEVFVGQSRQRDPIVAVGKPEGTLHAAQLQCGAPPVRGGHQGQDAQLGVPTMTHTARFLGDHAEGTDSG